MSGPPPIPTLFPSAPFCRSGGEGGAARALAREPRRLEREVRAAPVVSPAVAEAYRTPDDRFEGLPDFPFPPCYRQAAGLRLAHLDEGEGEPVVFFHGEPTWSYLWRRVF